MTARVLITGSRTWPTPGRIADVLADTWHDALELGHDGILVVHGEADGADAIARDWARANGVPDEPHAADWDLCGDDCPPGHRKRRRDGTEYCPTAGHRRNQLMVDLGAHLLVAFIVPCAQPRCPKPQPHDSHGTADCLRRAAAAQLPVRRITA